MQQSIRRISHRLTRTVCQIIHASFRYGAVRRDKSTRISRIIGSSSLCLQGVCAIAWGARPVCSRKGSAKRRTVCMSIDLVMSARVAVAGAPCRSGQSSLQHC